MVHSSEKLELATQYRKRGFTYSEIAKICGVSKATVSNWLSKKAFSKKIKQDNVRKANRENIKRLALVNKARQAERKRSYDNAKQSAKTEFKHYKTHPLFIAGLMIYLASGDIKDSSRIRVSSNKPVEHKVFIKFLVEFIGVDKSSIKTWLLLPSGQPESQAVNFWSKQIALSKSQFGKTQFLSHNKNKPLHNGTGNTIIASTLLKQKLNCWLEMIVKEL